MKGAARSTTTQGSATCAELSSVARISTTPRVCAARSWPRPCTASSSPASPPGFLSTYTSHRPISTLYRLSTDRSSLAPHPRNSGGRSEAKHSNQGAQLLDIFVPPTCAVAHRSAAAADVACAACSHCPICISTAQRDPQPLYIRRFVDLSPRRSNEMVCVLRAAG